MPTYYRDYMRGSRGSSEFKALKWLLIVNAVFFILQSIFTTWFGTTVLENFLSLSTKHLFSGFVWTLITYSFLHGDFFHVLINLLVIFFIGRAMEERYGSRRFLTIYFVAVLCGGLLWLIVNGGSGGLLVGASAGAFGLLTFFCLTQPEQPITLLLFFVVPVTVKPRWVLWGMLGMEAFLLIFYELPGRSTIASSAHLGGMLGSFIIFQILYQPGLLSRLKSVSMERPQWKKGKVFKQRSKKGFRLNIGKQETSEAMRAEVDRILDKINTKGFGALTQKEKETLDKAKANLGK